MESLKKYYQDIRSKRLVKRRILFNSKKIVYEDLIKLILKFIFASVQTLRYDKCKSIIENLDKLETFIHEELKFQDQLRSPNKSLAKLKIKKKTTKMEEPSKSLLPSIFQRRAESMRIEPKDEPVGYDEEKKLYKYPYLMTLRV